MSGLAALQSVQYATVNETRVAVININDWESLIEWLETLEDVQIAKQAFTELKAFGNDRNRAGWLRWDEVREELA